MKTTYFVDIDGTIASYNQRLKSVGPEPAREPFSVYQAWLDQLQTREALMKDLPVPGMLKLLEALNLVCEDWREEVKVVYLTAREVTLRDITRQWLQKNRFPNFDLHMRAKNDTREYPIFKEALIKSFKSDVNVIIDDDHTQKLAAICLANGWTFLKAVN